MRLTGLIPVLRWAGREYWWSSAPALLSSRRRGSGDRQSSTATSPSSRSSSRPSGHTGPGIQPNSFSTLKKCKNKFFTVTGMDTVYRRQWIPIQVLLFTKMRIRILPFNLIRIRILLHYAPKWPFKASIFSLWCGSGSSFPRMMRIHADPDLDPLQCT